MVDSFGSIEGVKIKRITAHGHDRGNFLEILKSDDGLLKEFGQASLSYTYPGIIKAFHYHKKQDDLWFILNGNAQIVLYDLRENSSTYKKTQVVYAGENYEPKLVVIPVGVAHGYRVLGDKGMCILYFTTLPYNPSDPDEYRIPFDDPEINFDWVTKNK